MAWNGTGSSWDRVIACQNQSTAWHSGVCAAIYCTLFDPHRRRITLEKIERTRVRIGIGRMDNIGLGLKRGVLEQRATSNRDSYEEKDEGEWRDRSRRRELAHNVVGAR